MNTLLIDSHIETVENVLNDLAECKGNDCKVIAVKSENGDTDQEACYCCNDGGYDDAYDKA